jgi:cysteinyl-tRNA synthetase
MNLTLYDTRRRAERVFKPLDRRHVRMYVCGPTVYDFAHIGNARPVIVFDVLFRLLRHIYGADHVTYVRNITDVDDKINARAAEEYPGLPLNEAIRKVTEKTERQFHEDVDALGCLRPTVEPRATEHIKQMKMIIGRLIKNRRAYVLDDHVLFRVKGLTSYGKLSHRSLKDMRTSERGEVAPKHDLMDFVLWKPSKPGEPSWPSPARIKTPGRPGWHLECSAMSWKYLGERFDIHGGGVDLLFPHHENEQAQSCRAFNRHKMAEFWMHNGFLQVEGEKMSKSLGNFFTIRDLLADWPGEVLRFNMLHTHYRQSMDWTVRGLEQCQKILDDWHHILGDMAMPEDASPDETVIESLCDDLNTSAAITRLHALANEIRGPASGFHQIKLKNSLKASGAVMGILERTEGAYLKSHPRRMVIDEDKVNALIKARAGARAAKDFIESDRIRDELKEMGVVLNDTKDGTTWEVQR